MLNAKIGKLASALGGLVVAGFFARRWGNLRTFVVQGKIVWFTLGFALALAIIVTACPTLSDEESARWLGMLLEASGVLIVFRGLVHLHDSIFPDRPLYQVMRRWLRLGWGAILPAPPQIISGVAIASGEATFHGAAVSLRTRAGPDATVEERLLRLEQNFGRLDQEQRDINAMVDGKIRDLQHAISKETTQRMAETADLRARQIQVAVGDLGPELAGVAMLLGGIVFATVPEWAACVLVPFELLWAAVL